MKQDSPFQVWEHVGNYDHMRPPGGPLSKNQQDAIDKQVSQQSKASAHQLHTGDIGPNSVPLSDISETLAIPRAARDQVSQSQIVTSPSMKNFYDEVGSFVWSNFALHARIGHWST